MSEPTPPTSLVAVRDRREAAIQRLSDSFAADLLTIEEFDERVERAHSATTLVEIAALIADLTVDLTAVASSTQLAPLSVEPSLSPIKKRIRSLFGNHERHGAWVVPDQLAVSSVFASTVLDFREARFTAQTTTIDVRVIFGNLEIIVPPQLAVECDGSSVFGNLECRAGAIVDPERPLLRIEGAAIFGSVEVHTRLPGESERDARKRHKRERKALKDGGPAALPARREK